MEQFDYELIYEEHSCVLCDRLCKGRRSLGNHLARTHKRKIFDYLLEFFFKGEHPECACGCGEPVKWHKTKYRFNEFVNGHNAGRDGFTSTRQPTFTDEQLQSRGDAIRKTYAEKGDEIRKKISESLTEVVRRKKDIDSDHYGRYMREKWQDDSFCSAQKVGRIRAWSGEAGQTRRKKVFTPEFGRKIAEANMRREIPRRSQKELHFIEWLKNTLKLRVVDPYWYNGSCVKCYDAYLPDENMLIEFDGVYWHMLEDNGKAPNATQITNVANDLAKNRLAVEQGKELIRIASDVDYDKCKSLAELKLLVYHHQLSDGTITKQGTFKFESDVSPIITREQLIQLAQKQPEIRTALIRPLRRLFHEHARSHGWPYPPSHIGFGEALASVRDAMSSQLKDDALSSMGTAGVKYLKSRFKSFWRVTDGVYDVFWNDEKLEKAIRYRLGLNNSKMYTYTLDDGSVVNTHETFDISQKNIRHGLTVQRHGVSFFKPATAAALYRHLIGDIEKPITWDPSCGFGARMLGFIAAYPDGTYIGTEPATMTYSDLVAMRVNDCHRFDIHLMQIPSEEAILEPDSLDLVFTSPPYFDVEKYFDEPTQCWQRYPCYEEWLDLYLLETMKRAHTALKSTGKMALNVANDMRDDVIAKAEEAGFTLINELKLTLGQHHFSRAKGHTDKRVEPILVFVPGATS